MSILTVANVQTWLESTKLTVTTVETGLESAANLRVISALSGIYDTSSWLDEASSPELVRQVMAMYYAAWLYRRQYSEDTDSEPNYADWLEGLADKLLMGLVDGSVNLPGIAVIGESDTGPDFYPRDDNFDSNGYRADDPMFSVGMSF